MAAQIAHLKRTQILSSLWRRLKLFGPLTQTNRIHHEKHYTSSKTDKPVRIGCASGFWGDTVTSVPQLLAGGNLDFLVFDYLSEITMSLLTAVKKKQPDFGYAPDFVLAAMTPALTEIKRKGIKVISNAGGVNPHSCALALTHIMHSLNIDLKIAVITGDDLMPKKDELIAKGVEEMQSRQPFPPTVNSMNAYLGAGPISRALDLGADIVVTGRCVDSALVLGPLLHTFRWDFNDFDKLAAGSLAGHLVECGAQATGGIFTDWYKVKSWANIGFPIVECSSDGSFILTKPPNTGGLVSPAVLSEQLLYEIGDPTRYLLPDVCCDFSNVKIEEVTEGESARVTGAKGSPPTPNFKVSATYSDGYRITAVACVGGPRAKAKAIRTAEEILTRCRAIFKKMHLEDFTKVQIEVLGSEHNYGPRTQLPDGPRECVLWLAAHHPQKKALEMFAHEIAPAGTGMAPGLTGIVGGRPRVSPVLKLFSFLYPKDTMKVDIYINGELQETYTNPEILTQKVINTQQQTTPKDETPYPELPTGPNSYRLEELAYTRSGDKGNNANIGVIARHPALLPYLRKALTDSAVEQYFSHLFEDVPGPQGKRVVRYDVPGVSGMNFVLYNSLGGGGIASLRSDPQGKAFGQIFLDFVVKDMPDLEELTKS